MTNEQAKKMLKAKLECLADIADMMTEGIVYGFVRLKHGTAEIIWS